MTQKEFDGKSCLQRIISRGEKVIAELRSIIADTNYFNGLPQMKNHVPFDCEVDRVNLANMLETVRQAKEQLAKHYP